MKTRNFLWLAFVGLILCVSSPAFAETTLFFDDFEDGLTTNGHIADNATVDPGSWTVEENVYDFVFTDIFGFGSTDGGSRYAGTLKGTKTGVGFVSTNLIAGGFTAVSNPTTLVRFEADVAIDNPATSNGPFLDIAMMNGATACDPLVVSGSGLARDTWYHFALEYYPGASSYDYSINGGAATTVALTTTASSISGLQIRGLSADTWIGFDNVKITAIPADVPEPSTVVLLTCGLLGLLVWRKRK